MASRYCYSNIDFMKRMERHKAEENAPLVKSRYETVLQAEKRRREFIHSRVFFLAAERDKRMHRARAFMLDLRRFL